MIDPNFVVEWSQFYCLRTNVSDVVDDGIEVDMAFDGGKQFEGKKRKTQLWGECENMVKKV